MPKSKFKINKLGRECTRCGKFKAWINFYKDKHAATGYVSHCNACDINANPKVVQSVNVKTKVCRQCNETKPIDQFRKRREDFGGGHHSICKVCHLRTKNGAKILLDAGEFDESEIDFARLITIKRKTKNSWGYPEALKFIQGVIADAALGGDRSKEIYAKHAPGRKYWSCHQLKVEITRAVEEAQKHGKKFNLKEYWLAGRKFSPAAMKDKIAWEKK